MSHIVMLKWKHEKTLSDKPREGRPPSFGEKEKKGMKKLIEENDPSKHGYNITSYTVERSTIQNLAAAVISSPVLIE